MWARIALVALAGAALPGVHCRPRLTQISESQHVSVLGNHDSRLNHGTGAAAGHKSAGRSLLFAVGALKPSTSVQPACMRFGPGRPVRASSSGDESAPWRSSAD